jgi:hypothetical protein
MNSTNALYSQNFSEKEIQEDTILSFGSEVNL